MIKEAYVSYEIAKLLKEKGFDEYCDYYYDQSSDEPQQLTLDEIYYSDEFIKAPTHQTACAWLREQGVYMSIDTVISSSGNIYFNIDTYSEDSGWNHPVDFYDSYEDAVEAALKYVLKNLI